MRRTLVLLAVLLATSLIGVRSSHAQFSTCTDEYIRSFEVPAYAWAPGDIDCHQFWAFSFSTPAGERWIRLIGDRNNATLALPPGATETIRQSAVRSVERMAELGTYLVDDITMLLGRPRAYPTEPQPEYGYSGAWTIRTPVPGEFDACHVTLFILDSFSSVDIHHTVGHEIFHCIEQATLTRAQYATADGAGSWWVEGAAELFGSLVAGTARGRWDRVEGFENSVRAREPLNDMSYDAAIFFLWHYQEQGLGALMPFLRRMADRNTSRAQEDAMAAVLTAEQWLDFAQAYDDRRIHDVGGGSLHFGQRVDGEIWAIDADFSAHRRDLYMFVIETGWAEYACGTWENEISYRSIEVRREDSTTWGRWPANLDTENRGDVRLRIVSMVTTPDDVEFRLEAEKRESCAGCLVSRAIDRCVVGRWRHTGGGPLEYLRRLPGVQIPTIVNQTELVLTMNDDGTFSTNDINTEVEMERDMPHGTLRATGVGRTSAVRGRWSAERGELLGCIDSGGELEGETTWPESPEAETVAAATRGRLGPYVSRSPWSGSAAGTSGGSTYTCSDTTLQTSSPTPHGPMEYKFTRDTPPPRRR